MTKVEKLRHEKRMSRRELGRLSDTCDTTIRRIEWEQDADNIRLRTYKKIADALGVSVLDVIEDKYLS